MGDGDNSTISLDRKPRKPRTSHDVWLRVVFPRDLVAEWPLTGDVVLGRNPETAEARQLRHPTISRRHAVLAWDRGLQLHTVEDAGSHNGTWIDGARLTRGRRSLRDGTVLRLGDVMLVYEHAPDARPDENGIVSRDAVPGDSGPACRLRARLLHAARDPSPVLLIGDTGSGKERIAAEVHRLSGRSGPYVPINCAALSRELLESQLFGHVKGAFTGASEPQPGLFRSANGGTLLLDEIGELPLELQPKLLRAIQEGEVQPVGTGRPVKVDVRLLAATNRDLSRRVAEGTFRRDLYARLAMWEILVPPLRDRRADILTWVDRLHRLWLDRRDGRDRPLDLTADAAEVILLAPWPENLRGLDRLLHELASRPSGAGPIQGDDLPAWIERDTGSTSGSLPDAPPPAPTPTREELLAVLETTAWNIRATARHFGRDRRQVYRWIDTFELTELRIR
jgi:transcriptional regulator with GAF, ATPase, and Fis domain